MAARGLVERHEDYGVIDDDFESSAVPNGIWLTLQERTDSGEHPVVRWDPGVSEPDDELEVVAADFGTLLKTRIEEGLARRGVAG